ncbi:MAG: hypothetical protein R3343_08520 [Nitriliruptorales bacterium]|nr:hypothetical protein [Nitriliruptorales bacterium]
MALDREGLRRALRTAYPWIGDEAFGPRTVDAGECDRCRKQPRLVPTCGPVGWRALCRECALEVGTDAWCDGHLADGREILGAIEELGGDWATVVLLWWIATGEVRHERLSEMPTTELPAGVAAHLPAGTTSVPQSEEGDRRE